MLLIGCGNTNTLAFLLSLCSWNLKGGIGSWQGNTQIWLQWGFVKLHSWVHGGQLPKWHLCGNLSAWWQKLGIRHKLLHFGGAIFFTPQGTKYSCYYFLE